MAVQITYADKSPGDQWTSLDCNEIKAAVNTNATELDGTTAKANTNESDIALIVAAIAGLVTPEQVLSAFSTATQSPAGTDNPLQVEFGAAQGGAPDPVEMNAAGLIQINQPGKYFISCRLSISRSSSSGQAFFLARWLIDGSQENVESVEMEDDGNTTHVQFFALRDLAIGQLITFEVARDSGGNNDGSLRGYSPAGLPWGDTPSASIQMFRVSKP